MSCVTLSEREILARQNPEHVCENTEQEQMTFFQRKSKNPLKREEKFRNRQLVGISCPEIGFI